MLTLFIINKLNHFLLFIFLLPIFTICGEQKRNYKGRFTENLGDYQLLVPHKIDYDGDFLTFNLPHYYEHDFSMRRRKRDYSSDPAVHYKLFFNGADHHLELFPNYDLLAPEAITERHYPDSDISVSARQLRKINPLQCHYTGKVRGIRSSSAAVSSCNGLSGYVRLKDKVYFIEPAEGYGPNNDGHHLHVIHTHSPVQKRNCGSKNWRAGWEEAFRYQQKMHAPVPPPTKAPEPEIYYLELLVVADKKFIDYHRDKDYENYILTIMNMASNLFHDGSVGHLIELNVVRIIYMDQYSSAIDLEVTQEASKSLSAFCKWQQDVNPKDLEHPQHHDIAILLTRQDICEGTDSDACQLLGLAYFTQACNPDRSCSINEDSGLVLGVVVAHEIGHILGADHDTEEDSGCKPEATADTSNIMSPIVKMASYTWSTCSKKYFAELFANGLGDCLMDEPADSAYKYSEMLPGSVYDADYQCRFFSAGTSACPISSDRLCEKLFCRTANNKCRSYGDPPADGTKCGKDQWCYRRECLPIGERPNSVAGRWSKWGNFSECSRTCGGGVQFAERECDNPPPRNGGLPCRGSNKKYQICNKASCGIGVKSFRATQCSTFDTKPFAAKFYTWLPYTPPKTDAENTCVLFCKRVNGTFAKLSPRAEDGTPCRKGSYDICLAGTCHKVGCDWKLDSQAIEDNCGICDGDGKDCEQISGVFSDRGTKYKKAIKIPKGARKIEIIEAEPSINMIAVQNSEGEFLLNGYPKKEESDGEKDLDDNLALYEHIEPKKEMLYIPGPTDQVLTILIYFNADENVGYEYSYYMFGMKTKQGKHGNETVKEISIGPEYHWENVDWSECSARCDGGEDKSESKCISNSGGGEVSDKFCLKLVPKPETLTRVCNKEECKTFWHTGDWAPCSGCKHSPGAQFRSVWCAKYSPRWEEADILTSEQDCLDVDGPKPFNKQLCVDECKKKNHRDGRSTTNSIGESRFSEKDIYNYRFFEKLFKIIDEEMKEPTDDIFMVSSYEARKKPCQTITESPEAPESPASPEPPKPPAPPEPPEPPKPTEPKEPSEPPEPPEQEPPEQEPDQEPEPEQTTTKPTRPPTATSPSPNPQNDSTDNNTETQLGNVQNPDNKLPEEDKEKCPARSILDSLGAHRLGEQKRMMFLFPRRSRFRLRRKIPHMRTVESKRQKPTLVVVKDRIPTNKITVEEANIKMSSVDWLSDIAYQKFGDRVSGTIDLDHEKVWRGPNAIAKIEKERKKAEAV